MENIKDKKALKLSSSYCKDTPIWKIDNFVFWEPCPDFVAFGIIYQLEI